MPSQVHQLNVSTPGTQRAALGTKLNQIITLINELRTDHDATVTSVDEGKTAIDELIADHATFVTLVTELKADMDSMGAAIDGICAKLDADAGITDTDYAAIHATGGSGDAVPADVTAAPPATLTAADPTAGPAAITAAAVDTLTS